MASFSKAIFGTALTCLLLLQPALAQIDIFKTILANDHQRFQEILKTDPSAVFSHKRIGMSGDLSPLHLAAFLGRTHMVAELIIAGAKVNDLDYSKQTPLHWAAMSTSSLSEVEAVINTLIAAGAAPEAKDAAGKTPLDRANQQPKPDIAEYLEKTINQQASKH